MRFKHIPPFCTAQQGVQLLETIDFDPQVDQVYNFVFEGTRLGLILDAVDKFQKKTLGYVKV